MKSNAFDTLSKRIDRNGEANASMIPTHRGDDSDRWYKSYRVRRYAKTAGKVVVGAGVVAGGYYGYQYLAGRFGGGGSTSGDGSADA